jgi:hypothetical protein
MASVAIGSFLLGGDSADPAVSQLGKTRADRTEGKNNLLAARRLSPNPPTHDAQQCRSDKALMRHTGESLFPRLAESGGVLRAACSPQLR